MNRCKLTIHRLTWCSIGMRSQLLLATINLLESKSVHFWAGSELSIRISKCIRLTHALKSLTRFIKVERHWELHLTKVMLGTDPEALLKWKILVLTVWLNFTDKPYHPIKDLFHNLELWGKQKECTQYCHHILKQLTQYLTEGPGKEALPVNPQTMEWLTLTDLTFKMINSPSSQVANKFPRLNSLTTKNPCLACSFKSLLEEGYRITRTIRTLLELLINQSKRSL